MEIIESCGNIFKDFGFSQEESDKLMIKSNLMIEVRNFIKDNGMTQAQAAELMSVTRLRISDVMRGKIDKFTIDALVDMLSKAGLQVAITVEHSAAWNSVGIPGTQFKLHTRSGKKVRTELEKLTARWLELPQDNQKRWVLRYCLFSNRDFLFSMFAFPSKHRVKKSQEAVYGLPEVINQWIWKFDGYDAAGRFMKSSWMDDWVERGFYFLGYQLTLDNITPASSTIEKFKRRIARLYEQGAGSIRIGRYV